MQKEGTIERRAMGFSIEYMLKIQEKLAHRIAWLWNFLKNYWEKVGSAQEKLSPLAPQCEGPGQFLKYLFLQERIFLQSIKVGQCHETSVVDPNKLNLEG